MHTREDTPPATAFEKENVMTPPAEVTMPLELAPEEIYYDLLRTDVGLDLEAATCAAKVAQAATEQLMAPQP